jgi:SPP1 gp7 family putative phage head morphogenesis protein
MIDYVHEYLKNNQEAILRGDSAALVRQDATPGGSYRRMVQSLNGWYTTYIPPLNDEGKRASPSIVFMGLGKIADSMADFNGKQWEKAAKAELGVEFPVYEDWWPNARENWLGTNYELMRGLGADYIKRINTLTEQAVTRGLSPAQLAQEIKKVDHTMTASKANFIARDQIGKLNGQVTQARMEAVGLNMYIWSTSGDERVRDSHANIDEALCRWDDSSVYSEDGGKTWKERPASWVQLHPGQDYQCRCCALSYWNELVDEVDSEIDLLSENVHNIPNAGSEGLRVMEPPSASSRNQSVQKAQRTAAAQRMAANLAANNKLAKKMFPNETWVNADSLKLNHVDIPQNTDGIKIAKGKLPINQQEELDLLKEIKSAIVLKSNGASVSLIPRIRRPDGKGFLPGPDAIVNGTLYEFKTVTGRLDKIGARFRESREQGNNVYIRVANPNFTKSRVVRYLAGFINNPKYQGGYKGKLILTIGTSHNKKTYFFRISDFKK